MNRYAPPAAAALRRRRFAPAALVCAGLAALLLAVPAAAQPEHVVALRLEAGSAFAPGADAKVVAKV